MYKEIDDYWKDSTVVGEYTLREIFGNKIIDKYKDSLIKDDYILYKGFLIKNISDSLFKDINYASNNSYYWKIYMSANYGSSFIGGSFAVYKNHFTMMPSRIVEIFSNNIDDSSMNMNDKDMELQFYKYPFEIKDEFDAKIHQIVNILHTIEIVGYKRDYCVRALKMYREKYNIDISDIIKLFNITKKYYREEVYGWLKY